MIRNVGMVERGVRLLVGILILGLYGALAPPWKYLTLIGLLPLGSALTGYCPVYDMLERRRARRGRESSKPANLPGK